MSIRSAQAIARALEMGENASRYSVMPFYIQKNGIWQGPEMGEAVLQAGVPPDNLTEGNRWQFPQAAASIDLWFPVLHGPNGEDGSVQGLLQLMGVPYVGPGIMASSVGMEGTTTQSSPSFQFTGVATWWWSVSCSESMTRRISSKLRPVLAG